MVEQHFKMTEVGLIPEDWEVRTLGELGEVKMCKRIFQEQTSPSGEIPFYKIGTFGKEPDAFISRTHFEDFRSKFSFPKKGDILISAAGTIGRTVVYNGEESYFQDSNIVWISNSEDIVSNKLLRFILNTVNYNTEGGTIQRLYNSILKSTKFILPHETEQRAIATALSDADCWIESLEKLLAKKRLIKQAAMQRLLTPGEDWEVKKLGEVGNIVTGGTPPTAIQEYWNGSFPWITPTDITRTKYILKGERSITQAGINKLRKLPADTLLVTCIASIGKNAVLRKVGACNQQINAIIPNELHNVDFLYYLIEVNHKILLGSAGITATLILSKKEFSELTFAFPSLKEQTRIATILSDMDAEIESLEKKLQKAKQIKQGMMQLLLTGKVRLVGKEEMAAERV